MVSTIWGICFSLKANPNGSNEKSFDTVLPRSMGWEPHHHACDPSRTSSRKPSTSELLPSCLRLQANDRAAGRRTETPKPGRALSTIRWPWHGHFPHRHGSTQAVRCQYGRTASFRHNRFILPAVEWAETSRSQLHWFSGQEVMIMSAHAMQQVEIPPVEAAQTSTPLAKARPSNGDIALLAYALWQERGCPEGSSEEDWFRGKQEFAGRAQG